MSDAHDFLHRLLDLVHEDIFEKVPRGQLKPGKGVNIRLERCKGLIKLADDVRAYLDDLEN